MTRLKGSGRECHDSCTTSNDAHDGVGAEKLEFSVQPRYEKRPSLARGVGGHCAFGGTLWYPFLHFWGYLHYRYESLVLGQDGLSLMP